MSKSEVNWTANILDASKAPFMAPEVIRTTAPVVELKFPSGYATFAKPEFRHTLEIGEKEVPVTTLSLELTEQERLNREGPREIADVPIADLATGRFVYQERLVNVAFAGFTTDQEHVKRQWKHRPSIRSQAASLMSSGSNTGA